MPISTHVLDTNLGQPAAGVPVTFSRLEDGQWILIETAVTDTDGRCPRFLVSECLASGTYKLRFETAIYYSCIGMQGLYPFVEITFQVIKGQSHYHIPLLLAANGYTTYRGS